MDGGVGEREGGAMMRRRDGLVSYVMVIIAKRQTLSLPSRWLGNVWHEVWTSARSFAYCLGLR